MPSQIKLNLSVKDRDRFKSVLAQAEKHGLVVTQSFEELGIASGSISDKSYPSLLRIDGINVEPDRAVSIPRRPA